MHLFPLSDSLSVLVFKLCTHIYNIYNVVCHKCATVCFTHF